MLKVDLTIEISRPPEDVFAWLTDVEQLTRWQKSLLDAHADEPFQKGTRIAEKRSLFGREAETELEVTALEPRAAADAQNRPRARRARSRPPA